MGQTHGVISRLGRLYPHMRKKRLVKSQFPKSGARKALRLSRKTRPPTSQNIINMSDEVARGSTLLPKNEIRALTKERYLIS